MLEIGDTAPDFSLPSTSGRNVALKDLRGRKVVLYFYPRDDTPGCTVEACDFRDNLARVRSAGADVYGVSKDTLASHGKFRAKFELPFELLADGGNAVARAYGAFGKKVMYGKTVEGTIRSTFLIDERGRIAHVWSPVKVKGHVDLVLAALHGAAHAPKRAAKVAVKSALTPARKLSAAKKARTVGELSRTAKGSAKKKPAARSTP